MCGICGFIDYGSNYNAGVLENMVHTMHHRGPDDKGNDIYTTGNAIVGLGHARLSILDLSPAGHQPMHYQHLSIVLNGEIYNFNEIKQDLIRLGHKFNSESDTEVILHSFLEWGPSSVSKFIGMFAFVILDMKKSEVILARDRAGVKPLFYYWNQGVFLFSSELKAFHSHPGFHKKINETAVQQYMDFGYIPSPYCIFENCKKLNPGHILTINIEKKSFETIKYWDVNDYYYLPKLNIPYPDALFEVKKLLHSAFEYRLVSDVPVGIFLSGGYDSTAVTAMLQSNRTEKLKTFTIGFEEGINEAPFAKAIASYLGTDHTEYYCTTKEAQEIIPGLSYFYDEPFADSSAIPTILVSKLARESVTVSLSADAGDEIFAGYSTYKSFLNDLSKIDRIPEFLKKGLGQLLDASGMIMSDQSYLKYKLAVLSKVLRTDKAQQPIELLRNYPHIKLNNLISSKLFLRKTDVYPTAYSGFCDKYVDNLSMSMAIDYVMYLQNDILTKVDRATMSVSLEGREPFLDHRIIEYVAQLPNEFKYGITQKRILKDIVNQYVPEKLTNRPKAGFSIPLNSWLKGDLHYLLEDNLNKTACEKTGFFDPQYVIYLRDQFMKGKLYDTTIIWKILQFQMWYTRWMTNSGT